MKRYCVLCLVLILAACGTGRTSFHGEAAQRIAAPAWMEHHIINAGPFELTSYERVRHGGGTARVYIEGDGLAWMTHSRPSRNPTPRNPMALHLAAKDSQDISVIWLARPCQYTGLVGDDAPCPAKYWKEARFAPEVIKAYEAALDDLIARHGFSAFELVGYSGGATVATLLAARRSDVVSLRTVAGNLDTGAQTAWHGVSPLSASLNPVDAADGPRLARVPQRHFIGGQDAVVPPAVLDSYTAALGPTPCARHTLVQNATHEAGWVERWPDLVGEPVSCIGGNREGQ